MAHEFKITHVGWYWLCPVHANLWSYEMMTIRPARPWLETWYHLQDYFEAVRNTVNLWFDTEDEGYPNYRLHEYFGSDTRWVHFLAYWRAFWKVDTTLP